MKVETSHVETDPTKARPESVKHVIAPILFPFVFLVVAKLIPTINKITPSPMFVIIDTGANGTKKSIMFLNILICCPPS